MKGKQKYIKLDVASKKELELGFKSGKKSTFRQRCHYILLSSQGKKMSEIAEIYQVRYETILKWIHRYEQGGIENLQTAKGKGRRPIIRIDNEVEVLQIEKWVEENPQNLNITLAKMEKELGKVVNKRTLQRFLAKKTGIGGV